MAKANRGGLGRGLNSLLGGSYESAPAPAQEPERVTVNSSEEKDSRPAEAVERVTVEAEDVEVIGSEKVIIKGVKERAAEDSTEKAPVEEKEEAPRQTDEVPLSLIIPNPEQPRIFFAADEIKQLAASIQKDGLLQPILVRPIEEGRFQIIAGERRWQACKALGLEKVPVRIKEAGDDDALELALIENIQRADLNPIEEAYGYRRLMDRKGFTQAEVAEAVSKGRSTIANSLRLLDLPEDAQQLLYEEKITAGHARAILSIPTEEGRQKLTEKLVSERISVREAEAYARLLSGKKPEASSSRQPLPKAYKKVAQELRSYLGTSARVKSVKGKNKIEIEFADEEDLKRLFALITKAE